MLAFSCKEHLVFISQPAFLILESDCDMPTIQTSCNLASVSYNILEKSQPRLASSEAFLVWCLGTVTVVAFMRCASIVSC